MVTYNNMADAAPSDWSRIRLKDTIVECKNGVWGEEPDGEDDLICVRVADFNPVRLCTNVNNLTLRSVRPADRRNRILNKGDLLLEKSGGGELQPVGRVVQYMEDAEAVCSNFVARMTPKPQYSSRYLTYLHAALYTLGVTRNFVKQTTGIQNLDAEDYLCEPVAVPPLDQQRRIAAYLDRETARIDALIAAKQELLQTLAERRQALITHAVTRGLDASVPRKDSGLPWLGEIPAHWKCAQLKMAWKVADCKHLTVEFVDDGYPVVSIGEVKNGIVELDNAKQATFQDFENLREGRVPKYGDIVFTRNATVGAIGLVTTSQQFCLGQDVCLITSREEHQGFLAYYLTSSVTSIQLDGVMIGSTFKRINVEE